MTQDKIIAILNKIRDDGDVNYKNTVPVLTENDLLSTYGAVIIGQPYVRNQFLNQFLNYFMYEETKQHIFESEFDRLKNPKNVNRYGSFEAFRNTIKPIEYDETKLDRVLKLYRPDVKTAYFTRNRQDIFPMSIALQELEPAFQSYEAFSNFVAGLYQQLTNSNKVVEYNAIKECINVNVNGGGIKVVKIPKITAQNAHEIATMIREYTTKMTKPSTAYNAYSEMDGAVGNPVETSTPRESLLMISDANTSATIGTEVLASAFNLEYVRFLENHIDVDDFGYNVYNRETQQVIGHTDSKIRFIICDEASFKLENNLDITAEGMNDAALVKQVFYHVWETIQMRSWTNCVAFVEDDETTVNDEISIDNNIVRYGSPANIKYNINADASITLKSYICGNGKMAEFNDATENTALIAMMTKVMTIDSETGEDNGIITVTRNNNDNVVAGYEYVVEETTETVDADDIEEITSVYGDNPYIMITAYNEKSNVKVSDTVFCAIGFKGGDYFTADTVSSNPFFTF